MFIITDSHNDDVARVVEDMYARLNAAAGKNL